MEDYLGVTIENDSEGIMQDIHWYDVVTFILFYYSLLVFISFLRYFVIGQVDILDTSQPTL